jgi:thymidylate synthase (FAD)
MTAPLTRPHSPALDALLGRRFDVLDHGFVRVIDYMGDDAAVVQAARVSYGEGTTTTRSDRGLIDYLMRHRHTTPFEMCELKLHVKLPVFVARQWIRHRMANVNEASARYSVMTREFYLPSPESVALQARDNKQGRGAAVDPHTAASFIEVLTNVSLSARDDYDGALEAGIARELARIGLTLNTYTEWYWKIDLHNLLHFLRLRSDGHAQAEIRAYANVIGDVVEQWVPHTWAAWVEHVRDAPRLSASAWRYIAAALNPEDLPVLLAPLPERERRETMSLITAAWAAKGGV